MQLDVHPLRGCASAQRADVHIKDILNYIFLEISGGQKVNTSED